MLKNKTLSLLLLAILLTGCASVSKNSPKKNAAESNNHYLKRAEINFQKGKYCIEKGNLENSKIYFDRVLNIILDSGADSLHSREHLKDYIAKISQIELDYLKDHVPGNMEQQEAFLDEAIATPLFTLTEEEITRIKKKMDRKKPTYSVPVTINKRVLAFIKAYQTVRHKNIQSALYRSKEYIERFKQVFRDKGMPEDLAYLPIIESGFRVHALSRARAMGVWQFMSSTARMYNLRVDWVVDERRDPYKAAEAAANLLQDLYKKFGDWYLALASYNAGPRRVSRAIRRLKTKDFFKIAKSRWHLRRETRNYIPAFLAALIIAKSPEEYGFTMEENESTASASRNIYLEACTEVFAGTKTVQAPSPVSLKEIASLTGVPYTTLKKINPELIRDFTPFNKKYYHLRVPEEFDEAPLAQLKRLPPEKKLFVGWYRVKRGDSLYAIARKFRTSVGKIKKTNKLRNNLIRPGKRLLIPRGL
ncbi:MAG: transglycosylase SLT domain-containing protein [bacterium]|nr:transglycosylase SLT domain-containing protein [bacterium]